MEQTGKPERRQGKQGVADVSIIVPVYGVERFLRASVESMRAQTHRQIEILLVEDGSPDACGALCDEYAQRDERIRVLHKRHEGTGMARNAGMDAARGEYLLFFDPDDTMYPTLVEENLALARRYGADMVVFGLEIQRYGGEGEPLGPPESDVPRVEGCFSRREFFERLPLHKFMPTLGCRLFRAEHLRRHGLRAGPYTTGQDAVFLYDVLAVPFERMAYSRGVYYTYHIREGSATRRSDPQRLENEARIARHFEAMIAAAPAPYADGRYDGLIDAQYLMGAKRALRSLAVYSGLPLKTLARLCRRHMQGERMARALRRQRIAAQPGMGAKLSLLLLRTGQYRLYLGLLRAQGKG